MKRWINRNKLLIAVISLLFIANLYVLMLVSNNEPVVNTTTPNITQVNNINGSEGFSVNGNVTNNQPVKVITRQIPIKVVEPVDISDPKNTNKDTSG